MQHLRFLLPFLLLVVTGSVFAETEEDRAAVLLREAPFLTPAAAAGSGLEPEVKVRVEIDEHGRVAQAEVLSIEPSSRYDEHFREATLSDLRTQRYAPAIVDGEEVSQTLEWMIQFRAGSGLGAARGDMFDPWRMNVGFFGLQDEVDARAERFDRMRERQREYMRAGERQLLREPIRIDTPRFVVLSDLPEENRKTVEAVANNLEVLFHVLDELFVDAIPMHRDQFKHVVFLYAERTSYFAFLADLQVFGAFSGGVVLGDGVVAFQAQRTGVDPLHHSVLHEGTHAWAKHHLLSAGLALPRWLEEGLAEYVSYSKIRRGEMVFGKEQRRRFVMRHGAVWKEKTAAGITIEDVKNAVSRGEGMDLEGIVQAEREIFFQDTGWVYYPMSWIFVHYLRHGEESWVSDEFPRFLLYVAEGYDPHDVLQDVYGKTPADMEEAYRKYAKRF